MSFLQASRCLGIWATFWVVFLVVRVQGQRIKEGCFDTFTISCDNLRVNPKDVDFSIREVCQKLAVDIFPNDEIVFDPLRHEDYLNSIEADSEFCSQVQIAYSQCVFCAEWTFVSECHSMAFGARCGDQPDRQQVLADNETYAHFQTEADIDESCTEMQEASAWSFPMTIDLCERQSLAKHLCPGNCEGTCFDLNVHPPTCDPNAYSNPVNESLDTHAFCGIISDFAFYFADDETVMDTSKHADYLRAIPNDMCAEARQAYSDCAWCDKSKCFDETNPVTCQAPDVAVETSVEEDEAVCSEIFFSFYETDLIKDIFNISKHTKHLRIKNNTSICNRARQSYHKCYWCAGEDVPEDFCSWEANCRGDINLPKGFVSHTLEALNITDSPEEKCAEIHDHWDGREDTFTLQRCDNEAYLAKICPEYFCIQAEAAEAINANYLGATTTAQKRALIWMSRVSAFLSFFGASCILYDIFSDSKNRRTVYHKLLVGMAIADIVTAFAWGFATAPIDKEAAGHVEGAMGTAGTCKAQAFFIQLGFTSIFYNVSLAIYYVLVVAYDWREFHLKKIQLYMLLLPPLVGFVLAFGAIPSYHWIEYGCHILPPPDGGDMWAVLVFVVLPLGFAIMTIMVSMMVVYCKVRRQAAASAKWSFGISMASALEQAVFWQCLFYVLAFLVSWPILFAVYLASVDVDGPLGLTLTVAFVAPLQGFNNFLVYIRPKLKKQTTGGRSDMRRSSKASIFAVMRNSVRRRTSWSSSANSASWFLRRNKTDESISVNAFDPSVALALDSAGNAFRDSGLSNRAPLSVVQEVSIFEDAAIQSSRLISDQENPSSNVTKESNEKPGTSGDANGSSEVHFSDHFDDEDDDASTQSSRLISDQEQPSSNVTKESNEKPNTADDAIDSSELHLSDHFDDEG